MGLFDDKPITLTGMELDIPSLALSYSRFEKTPFLNEFLKLLVKAEYPEFEDYYFRILSHEFERSSYRIFIKIRVGIKKFKH